MEILLEIAFMPIACVVARCAGDATSDDMEETDEDLYQESPPASTSNKAPAGEVIATSYCRSVCASECSVVPVA